MAGPTGSSIDKVLRSLHFFVVAALIIFAHDLRAEDVLLTVNIKKPLALTSDKFLSYTLDPTVVLTSDVLMKNSERSMNMAKALAPAYVRIGGPRSNSYTFERTYRSQDEEDPGFTFTETNWMNVHRWAENAGLDVLACIAPQHSESGGRDTGWDSRNALDLISFSDHVGLNTNWQLGYECQTRCDVAGSDIGKDVIRLRSMLDAFPRYSQSIIAGPDVVTYRTKQQQQYLQDFLNVAGTALSAITWHPDFASITLDAEGVSMHHDNLALDRDSMYRVVGRLISKKPLWLAESKPEECKRQFLGALVWTRRLGNAAKLGVQVLMRQPDGSNLFQPSPDYWVSVLHKTLVGREVLDTKIVTGNRTHVHFYCQCTRPSSKYEKGSLTIFGINLTPVKVVANLKGVKVKTLHKYILLPGFDAENRMFSETVLLNNEPLNLLNGSVLPEIKPAISNNSKGVTLKLPSGGIGFWVIPGLKIKSCGGLDEDNSDKMLLKKLTKRLDVAESDEESVNEENGEEDDDEEHISSEERRHSTKSSKDKRRRKHRFSEEDDAEKRSRKFEARMDLEKLEKLLRRRDSHDERKSPRGRTAYFGFEEKSQEKIIDEDDDETGAEIRSKLEEYKNRLRDYENRKKSEAKSRDRSKIPDSLDSERIDSEKVSEALALILKMENAMNKFEEVNDQSPVDTLDPSVSYNVTSGLTRPGGHRNPEDMFLDELLKSAKIKRTSVPSKIEVQLRTIYQMLAEERLRRQRNSTETPVVEVTGHVEEPLQKIDEGLSRNRRETEKKFEDDPLGLRKEGLFRRRTKNDDARDRRIDRKTRRKDKDDRKDGQAVIFDPKTAVDSNENNFYGFHRREPLKGFPEGDLFFTTGTSSEERGKDYDYVRDDDDAPDRERPKKIPKTNEKVTNQSDADDTTWVEDENTQLNHVPHEFFEDVKMAVPRVQENLKEYGELWEAEALGESQDDHQDHFNDGDEKATVEKIVQERRFDAHEDKRAKETAVRKLIGYYENPRSDHEELTDYFGPEKNEKSRTGMRNSPRNNPSEAQNKKPSAESPAVRKRVKDSALNEYGGFANFDSMHFSRAPISSPEDESLYDVEYPVARPAMRIKRSADDLETILDREMIFQDDNNLKDCECRVIRGTRASKRRGEREHGKRPHRPGKSERWGDEDRVARAERRKQRNRDGVSRPGAARQFDEDYMHATRSKRDVGSSGEVVKESIAVEPHTSIEYPTNESDSMVKESQSSLGEEIPREENVHIEKSKDDAGQEAANNFKGADEVQGNTAKKDDGDVEKTKDLAVEEENTKLTVEKARVERRKQRNRDGVSRPGAARQFDEDYMHATRSKRDVGSSGVDVKESIAVEPHISTEYPTDESDSMVKESQSSLGEEIPREENVHIEKSKDDAGQEAANNFKGADEIQGNTAEKDDGDVKKTKDLAVEEEKTKLTVEKARVERRKQRNRDGVSRPGAARQFDEDYMHATRSKRDVGSSGEDVKESVVVEPHISIEYPTNESDSMVKESQSSLGEEIPREENVHIAKSKDDAGQEAANNFKGADEVQGNTAEKDDGDVEKTKDLAVEEENTKLTVEKARVERRKQRNRDGVSRPGAARVFDEDYMHATRSKRDVGSSGENVKESTAVEPHISIEYPTVESDSMVKESESSLGEEIPREENVHIEKSKDDAGQEAANNFKGADEVQGNTGDVEKTKDLAVEEDNTKLTIEKAEENSDRGKILKRHNESKAIVTEGTKTTETESQEKSISPASEDIKESSVKTLSELEEPTNISPKDSTADQSFLGTESNNDEKSSSTVEETPDSDAASPEFETDESLQSVQTPSSENNQSIVDSPSNSSEANLKNSLPVSISKSVKVVEEDIAPTEQKGGEISMTLTTDNIEDQKTSIFITKDIEKGTVSDDRIELDDGEYTTDNPTTESGTTPLIKKGISKSLKLAKDSPRMPRKAQKTKQTVKMVDPSKAREARMAARADALMALRKENEARKSKKSLETTSKLLLSEHTKFQSMQKKRAEQLEKLREKLRRQRAKMVPEYRNEMLDDLDEASSDEERNLKRREIIDMLNDDELRDIVDRDKLEYLMQNKPVNYEAVKNEFQVDKAAQRRKYVPAMVEIVKRLSEVRERKVKPNEPIRHSNDPRVLAYGSSDELTNSEDIRKALQGRIDLGDQKVKRRSGKIYYSIVESLENPRIYEYPRSTEHESGEEESNELDETLDLEQARSRSSLQNKYEVGENVQKGNEGLSYAKENRHYKDYKRPHKVSGSQEERDKSLMSSKYPPRLTRNTSNRKNKFMCLNKNLDENSNGNRDELFDLVKAKNHYMKKPVQNGKSYNDEFSAKKKFSKDSNYELNSKYESPKYARLASKKVEVQRDKLVNSRKYLEDDHLEPDDNEELLQEIASITDRKSKESNDKVQLRRHNSTTEDHEEQRESDTEIIDDLDLDDILNLSKYELLMLIPVKNYKKSRSRRHIANEIIRNQEDSASNEISDEIRLKNKEILNEEISGSRTENSGDLSQGLKSIDSDQTNGTKNSISESSTVLEVENFNNNSVQEIPRSVPEVANDKESHNNVLPELLEKHIPRLEAIVPSGLIKVRHISESFEKFIDGFKDRLDQKQPEFEKENRGSIEPTTIKNVPVKGNIFSTATTNLKKFFDFLSNIIRIFKFV